MENEFVSAERLRESAENARETAKIEIESADYGNGSAADEFDSAESRID